jgi:hypothetical protein
MRGTERARIEREPGRHVGADVHAEVGGAVHASGHAGKEPLGAQREEGVAPAAQIAGDLLHVGAVGRERERGGAARGFDRRVHPDACDIRAVAHPHAGVERSCGGSNEVSAAQALAERRAG